MGQGRNSLSKILDLRDFEREGKGGLNHVIDLGFKRKKFAEETLEKISVSLPIGA